MSQVIQLPIGRCNSPGELLEIVKGLFEKEGCTIQTYGFTKNKIILIGKSWIVGSQIVYNSQKHCLVFTESFGRKSVLWLGTGAMFVLAFRKDERKTFNELVYTLLYQYFFKDGPDLLKQ